MTKASYRQPPGGGRTGKICRHPRCGASRLLFRLFPRLPRLLRFKQVSANRRIRLNRAKMKILHPPPVVSLAPSATFCAHFPHFVAFVSLCLNQSPAPSSRSCPHLCQSVSICGPKPLASCDPCSLKAATKARIVQAGAKSCKNENFSTSHFQSLCGHVEEPLAPSAEFLYHPAMGRIVKRVRKSCFLLKASSLLFSSFSLSFCRCEVGSPPLVEHRSRDLA